VFSVPVVHPLRDRNSSSRPLGGSRINGRRSEGQGTLVLSHHILQTPSHHMAFNADGFGSIVRLRSRDGSDLGARPEDLDSLIGTLVRQVEGEGGEHNCLLGFSESDALFGFAVRTHLDNLHREAQAPEITPLGRVLQLGIYDWLDTHGPIDSSELRQSLRYSAVLGNALLKRIEVLEQRVSLAIVAEDFGLIPFSSVSNKRSLCCSNSYPIRPWSRRWSSSSRLSMTGIGSSRGT
jgi:hypothetical protein